MILARTALSGSDYLTGNVLDGAEIFGRHEKVAGVFSHF